jgi:C-terminal processing protease CtpA/Prc
MVLALRTLPDIVTVGDFTGGISANPVERVAANGWRYTISRWIEYLPDNSTFEGIGLEPDIRVDITAADAAVQRDTILDAAIAELSLRIP